MWEEESGTVIFSAIITWRWSKTDGQTGEGRSRDGLKGENPAPSFRSSGNLWVLKMSIPNTISFYAKTHICVSVTFNQKDPTSTASMDMESLLGKICMASTKQGGLLTWPGGLTAAPALGTEQRTKTSLEQEGRAQCAGACFWRVLVQQMGRPRGQAARAGTSAVDEFSLDQKTVFDLFCCFVFRFFATCIYFLVIMPPTLFRGAWLSSALED